MGVGGEFCFRYFEFEMFGAMFNKKFKMLEIRVEVKISRRIDV